MGPETAVSAQKGTFRGSGSGLLSGDWSTYDQSQLPQGTTGGDDRTDELWAGGWNLAQFTGVLWVVGPGGSLLFCGDTH